MFQAVSWSDRQAIQVRYSLILYFYNRVVCCREKISFANAREMLQHGIIEGRGKMARIIFEVFISLVVLYFKSS